MLLCVGGLSNPVAPPRSRTRVLEPPHGGYHPRVRPASGRRVGACATADAGTTTGAIATSPKAAKVMRTVRSTGTSNVERLVVGCRIVIGRENGVKVGDLGRKASLPSVGVMALTVKASHTPQSPPVNPSRDVAPQPSHPHNAGSPIRACAPYARTLRTVARSACCSARRSLRRYVGRGFRTASPRCDPHGAAV